MVKKKRKIKECGIPFPGNLKSNSSTVSGRTENIPGQAKRKKRPKLVCSKKKKRMSSRR